MVKEGLLLHLQQLRPPLLRQGLARLDPLRRGFAVGVEPAASLIEHGGALFGGVGNFSILCRTSRDGRRSLAILVLFAFGVFEATSHPE